MAAAFAERLLQAFQEAGLERETCHFDEASGQMVISGNVTRVVPVATLFSQYARADEAAKGKLLDAALKAFVEGDADVPETADERLLPQLWSKQRIAARQLTLPPGFELPHCGLHGEMPAGDLGVVLVCDYKSDSLSIETPVLSSDLSRWSLSFTAATQKALENLRSRTKRGPSANSRWEHHPTGCGESCWKDGFDAVRVALFPKLVAARKRPDGVAEQGGHVVAFATSSCVLASVSKNALGLCFMGDTLNLQMAQDAKLSATPMRLLKMKDSRASSERHPLESSASEGMVWRWMPYTPGGPPLHSPGEFSVPIDQGEVDAILEAAEKGRPVPVFTQNVAKKAASSDGFAKKKEEGNALFKAGDFVKAVAAYDSALAEPAPDGEAAVAHSNAAQALLKLADAEAGDRRKACAAEALRRAREAIQLDPTNIKALARCAAACDLLGEAEAAAEFRQHQQGCEAACEATRAARRAEVERQQRAQEEQKQRLAAAREEEERLEALMRRERALEQQRREVEETQANEATATRLSAMLGMGGLAGVGKA
ncbi:unnamed protein product [Effrenium voratum]|nr:unnamed protein product [Effrenium voratum]